MCFKFAEAPDDRVRGKRLHPDGVRRCRIARRAEFIEIGTNAKRLAGPPQPHRGNFWIKCRHGEGFMQRIPHCPVNGIAGIGTVKANVDHIVMTRDIDSPRHGLGHCRRAPGKPRRVSGTTLQQTISDRFLHKTVRQIFKINRAQQIQRRSGSFWPGRHMLCQLCDGNRRLSQFGKGGGNIAGAHSPHVALDESNGNRHAELVAGSARQSESGLMATLQELSESALQRDPARPAIEFNGIWFDWGALSRVANAVRALLRESGIAPDAPVAFIPRNRPAALATLLALIADGRTIRMIYAFQSPAGIARDIARLRPAALIADAQDVVPDVHAALAAEGIAAIALAGMDAHSVSGLEKAGAVYARIAPTEPHIEILTSGTTGPPKQFAISYALLETHFVNSTLARQQGDNAETLPPFLLFFPLGNISGIYSTLPMLLRGQRIVLLERFSLEGWHDYVKRYRPVHSGLPPSFVQQVLDAGIPKEDLASIRVMGVGAAPLDPTAQKAFEDHYGIPILLSYGATEFAGPVACMTAELHAEWGRKKLGTVGRAMPGAQLRIVDPDTGDVLPPGEEGLLEVVSPRLGPDWIRTSDVAIIDADGFLFHRGRADGAIMRGGFKVLPESVERALMLHPAVSEAAVTGISDHRLGQVPAAAIRLKPGMPPPSVDQLETHLRQLLLSTHIPAKWLFCAELPRTPSLKADRPAVRRLFESG